jgi:hypothetical protein
MNKVLLINRAMGHGSPCTLVQGWNGEQIGFSQFNPKYSCHTCEITVDEYNKVAESLSRASHIAMRLWEPHFVVEQIPKEVEEFAAGFEYGKTGNPIMESMGGPLFKAGYEAAGGYELSKKMEIAVFGDKSYDLDSAPFFKLRKIAKEEGVEIHEGDGCDNIRAAIRANREPVPA